MGIELVAADAARADELARVCHLAFNTLHERHRIPADVPTEEVGRMIIGGVIGRDDYAGVMAVEHGRVVGSNFVQFSDGVCGLGPITVDPAAQSAGVGRMLMEWAVGEAKRRRGEGVRVRLYQEAINTVSLSLYTRVGFRWHDAAALMLPRAAGAEVAGVRPMTRGDLDAVAALSERFGGSSRRHDAARLLAMGMPASVLERGGRVVAYQVSTLFGHAAGERAEDLISLASNAARHLPEPMTVVIVPLSQGDLFNAALGAGFRVHKLLNGMAYGEHVAATGPCMPSIQC